MMASLGKHENVAELVDGFVEECGQLNVATEFLGGGDMEAMNRRLKEAMEDGKISYGDYVGAMQYLHKGVLQGVAHLEDNEVAHGDLKPDNVALDDDMVPKIIDFGTARRFGERNAGVGNLAYGLSPESASGNANASRGRDVFAVGQMVREGTEGFVSDRGGNMQVNRRGRHGVQGSSIEVREDGPERVTRDILEDDEVVGTEDLGRKDGSFAVHTALTDFLEGTTSNRVEDRFTAQRALDSQFLQDPLLQDEQAQDLLKRLSGRGPETQAEDIELATLGEDEEAHGTKSAMQYELLKRTKARRKALDKDASKRSKQVKKDTKAIDKRRARA
jgi:serine/threonine protein kinase